jgi:phosphoribosylaminoimidazole-succinocarboxamide synthase
MTPLYEGKAKPLWATEDPNTLRMEFKDDATAFDGKKKAQFDNKGRLNNAISNLIYGMLEKEGVPTHFVRQIDDTNVEVKKVDILMIEVIVRNIAAGSFCRRTGMPEGHVFSQPIVEFSYKDDALGDPRGPRPPPRVGPQGERPALRLLREMRPQTGGFQARIRSARLRSLGHRPRR